MRDYYNEDWLRNEIEVKGKTHKEVAEMFGVTGVTIKYHADKYNIVRPGNTKTKENMENASKLRDRDWLQHEYITLNKSYEMIAQEYGVGKTTVARWVKKFELHNLKNTKHSGKRVNEGSNVTVSCAHCGEKRTIKYCRYEEGLNRFCDKKCSARYDMEHTDKYEKMNLGLEEWRKTPEAQIYMREHGARTHANQDTKETGIERKIREMLVREGIEFETQKQMYYWCVDFYLPEYDIVIEAQGDYWHAHPDKYPEPNAMQKKNIRRDKGKAAYIPKCGHVFLAFWERDINEFPEAVLNEIKTAMLIKTAAA